MEAFTLFTQIGNEISSTALHEESKRPKYMGIMRFKTKIDFH